MNPPSMTEPAKDRYQEYPGWPRGLSRVLAARYIGVCRRRYGTNLFTMEECQNLSVSTPVVFGTVA
jgi:hypothetical protein